MKKLIVIALGLLTAAALYAQDFDGWQMPKIEMEYSQKFADVNYAGDSEVFHNMDIYVVEGGGHGFNMYSWMISELTIKQIITLWI